MNDIINQIKILETKCKAYDDKKKGKAEIISAYAELKNMMDDLTMTIRNTYNISDSQINAFIQYNSHMENITKQEEE